MIVKNTTAEPYAINKSVQVDVGTPDENDGYVLPAQALELSTSMNANDLITSEQLRDGVFAGKLVFVVDGNELDTTQSIQIYNSGPTSWAKIFNPEISETNLFEGMASGFIYARNCQVG